MDRLQDVHDLVLRATVQIVNKPPPRANRGVGAADAPGRSGCPRRPCAGSPCADRRQGRAADLADPPAARKELKGPCWGLRAGATRSRAALARRSLIVLTQRTGPGDTRRRPPRRTCHSHDLPCDRKASRAPGPRVAGESDYPCALLARVRRGSRYWRRPSSRVDGYTDSSVPVGTYRRAAPRHGGSTSPRQPLSSSPLGEGDYPSRGRHDVTGRRSRHVARPRSTLANEDQRRQKRTRATTRRTTPRPCAHVQSDG